jgi:hypothetical protein
MSSLSFTEIKSVFLSILYFSSGKINPSQYVIEILDESCPPFHFCVFDESFPHSTSVYLMNLARHFISVFLLGQDEAPFER